MLSSTTASQKIKKKKGGPFEKRNFARKGGDRQRCHNTTETDSSY